jgi:hypothetical protein
LASVPSARTSTLILFACVPIVILFSFTIATLAEVVAVLALFGLTAHRVDEWTRVWRASKRSG